MSITPTGNPAWVRSNGHDAYGGNINKTNYQSIGTINPRTDLSAENLCRIAADMAEVARTAPFAVVTYKCNDAPPLAPTINNYFAMAGSAPVGTRNANGDVTLTWLGNYTDDYNVTGPANIVAATVCVHGVSGYVPTVELIDADADGIHETIRVRVFDILMFPVPDVTVSLSLWTG